MICSGSDLKSHVAVKEQQNMRSLFSVSPMSEAGGSLEPGV